MSTTPPGWYDDGSGIQRWWDGSAWTEHVQQGAPTAAEALADLDPAAAASAGIAVYGAPAGYPGNAVPRGYGAPGGYPGQAVSSQEPAKKSKLWILFVVLGVLVVVLIALAALFIPRLIGSITASDGASGSSDREQAAIVAVESYDDAWNDADCVLYFATTTETYREALGMMDCATFEDEARFFGESTDEYELTVDSVESADDVITVLTTETFLSLIDENGEPLATPETVSTPYEYTLVPADGGWAIDDVL